MELNDLLAPLEEQEAAQIQDNLQDEDGYSNLTISLAPSHNSAPATKSANGPLKIQPISTVFLI